MAARRIFARSGIPATMIRFHRNDLPAEASFGEAAAIDTETLGLAVGRDRLCVVQISRGDGTADIVQIAAGQTIAQPGTRLDDDLRADAGRIAHRDRQMSFGHYFSYPSVLIPKFVSLLGPTFTNFGIERTLGRGDELVI